MVAAVEGAIDVGHLVRLKGLRQGTANLAQLTLPADNPLVGQRVSNLVLPANSAWSTMLRGDHVILPKGDDLLEAGDEMLFVAESDVEDRIGPWCTANHRRAARGESEPVDWGQSKVSPADTPTEIGVPCSPSSVPTRLRPRWLPCSSTGTGGWRSIPGVGAAGLVGLGGAELAGV